jgi:hypothetical protein
MRGSRAPRWLTPLSLVLVVVAALGVRPLQGHDALREQASGATAAALDLFHAVLQSDCNGNNPDHSSCVAIESTPTDVEHGIAAFGVGDPDGNGGFAAVMGRTSGGAWKLWFTSQNPYQLTRLPGDMVVCAGGTGVNLRDGPSTDAAVVGMLPDSTRVTGEEFVLTEPVDPGNAGFGWFRISAPKAGWVYSKYVEAAALNDNCALHNAQVSGT